jgi:hypothetical protein
MHPTWLSIVKQTDTLHSGQPTRRPWNTYGKSMVLDAKIIAVA